MSVAVPKYVLLVALIGLIDGHLRWDKYGSIFGSLQILVEKYCFLKEFDELVGFVVEHQGAKEIFVVEKSYHRSDQKYLIITITTISKSLFYSFYEHIVFECLLLKYFSVFSKMYSLKPYLSSNLYLNDSPKKE